MDLISYEITALKPILQVIEAVPSHGHVSGSTMFPRRFEPKLSQKPFGFTHEEMWSCRPFILNQLPVEIQRSIYAHLFEGQ